MHTCEKNLFQTAYPQPSREVVEKAVKKYDCVNDFESWCSKVPDMIVFYSPTPPPFNVQPFQAKQVSVKLAVTQLWDEVREGRLNEKKIY